MTIRIKHRDIACPGVSLQKQLSVSNDLIDQTVFLRRLRIHEVVALGVLTNDFNRLARVRRKNLIKLLARADQVIRVFCGLPMTLKGENPV